MIIVGAGMAGLLAARMLSHRKPVVWETQKALPNNHSAVLRFRTSQVGDILGIPFKKVNMIKDTLHWRNPIADSLAYSYKNSGSYRSDRSVTRGLVSEERFIAPPDLISQMAEGVKIEFGREYDPNDPHVRGSNVISTIPMPALIDLLDYDMGPDFSYRSGWTVEASIHNCDAYVSLLVPDPAHAFSRLSLTGNRLIIEIPDGYAFADRGTAAYLDAHENVSNMVHEALDAMGIAYSMLASFGKPKASHYNKIIPIDDESRKRFMLWATNNCHVYSLGRFATWRPGLLLDDLVKDVRLIDKWTRSSGYDMAVHAAR
jgi:hypothetical protein